MPKYHRAYRLKDLRELVERAHNQCGPRFAFRELDSRRQVHAYTFDDLYQHVVALGTKILDMGLTGKHCALIGTSSFSYVVAYLAVTNTGNVIVPLDKDLTCDDLIKLINKSDAEVIFYSDIVAPDMPAIRAACPQVQMTINISMDSEPHDDLDFKTLVHEGIGLLEDGDTRYRNVTIDPEAMSTILFTSGTTGANKGVMLSQKNLVTVIHSAFAMFRFPKESISVLPINHAYEFNLHVLGAIYAGIALDFNDSVRHVKENLTRFRPEMSLMVPMIVEALYKNIWKEARETNLEKQLKYGIWFSNLIRKFGIDRRRFFFKPIILALGGRLKLIVCGGAPLRPEIVKGFDDLGIDVYNGYGITECSPLISSNCTVKSIPGSVGILAPDNEVRIADKAKDGTGEIQVKGDNVMLGYYNDPIATEKAFTPDGWFRTGDIGYLDRNGALFITGREKNTIILPNGKNVQPEELEEHLLNNLDYVREVVVHQTGSNDDQTQQIGCLAYLDPDYLEAVGLEAAEARLRTDVARLNRKLAVYKRIQHVEVRDSEFDKTTTKKIKRYAMQGKDTTNA